MLKIIKKFLMDVLGQEIVLNEQKRWLERWIKGVRYDVFKWTEVKEEK